MNNNFYCYICNKYYKNNNSYGNHNRRFHESQNEPKLAQMEPNGAKIGSEFTLSKNNYTCKYCNYSFKWSNSLSKHINFNRCKVLSKLNKEKELKEENEKLKEIIKEDKKNIKKLENKVENIEKILGNTNSGNNTTNNNATLNNFQQTNNVLVQLGKENIIDVMPKSDQIKILNTCYNSLYRLVKEIHCNDKYPQFRNVAITNLTDNYGHRYDDKLKIFVKCHKNDLIETLIENRIVDIEDILNANIDEISEEKAKKLNILIEEINDRRGCYKDKKEQIKLLLYNECKVIF